MIEKNMNKSAFIRTCLEYTYRSINNFCMLHDELMGTNFIYMSTVDKFERFINCDISAMARSIEGNDHVRSIKFVSILMDVAAYINLAAREVKFGIGSTFRGGDGFVENDKLGLKFREANTYTFTKEFKGLLTESKVNSIFNKMKEPFNGLVGMKVSNLKENLYNKRFFTTKLASQEYLDVTSTFTVVASLIVAELGVRYIKKNQSKSELIGVKLDYAKRISTSLTYMPDIFISSGYYNSTTLIAYIAMRDSKPETLEEFNGMDLLVKLTSDREFIGLCIQRQILDAVYLELEDIINSRIREPKRFLLFLHLLHNTGVIAHKLVDFLVKTSRKGIVRKDNIDIKSKVRLIDDIIGGTNISPSMFNDVEKSQLLEMLYTSICGESLAKLLADIPEDYKAETFELYLSFIPQKETTRMLDALHSSIENALMRGDVEIVNVEDGFEGISNNKKKKKIILN